MGVLFLEKNQGFINNYTQEQKGQLDLIDKISDIFISHARIDNLLLVKVLWCAGSVKNWKFFDTEFHRQLLRNGGKLKIIQNVQKNVNIKVKKMQIPDCEDEYFVKVFFWRILFYNLTFDMSGNARDRIEKILNLKYHKKIDILSKLNILDKEEAKHFRRMGELRNFLAHHDVIYRWHLEEIEENKKPDKQSQWLFNHFGYLENNRYTDIDKIYHEYNYLLANQSFFPKKELYLFRESNNDSA